MRVFTMILASALGGALLAVALVYAMASSGMMPINDRQMQTYLMLHPDLAMAMMGRYQTLEDEKERAEKAAAMKRIDPAAFFVVVQPTDTVATTTAAAAQGTHENAVGRQGRR